MVSVVETPSPVAAATTSLNATELVGMVGGRVDEDGGVVVPGVATGQS